MTKTFEIKRTPQVKALLDKYSTYADDYILSDEEEQIVKLLPHLSEWELVVLFALVEVKSVRKFAKFFDITEFKARQTIALIREKMKRLAKKKGGVR